MKEKTLQKLFLHADSSLSELPLTNYCNIAPQKSHRNVFAAERTRFCEISNC